MQKYGGISRKKPDPKGKTLRDSVQDDIPETAQLYTVIRFVASRSFVGLPWWLRS